MTNRPASLAVLLFGVVGCGGNRGDVQPDAAGAFEVDATVTVDAAPDAPLPPDPWTQTLGDPVAGVTLADGWTDLRLLPTPVAIAGGWTDSLFATPDGLHLRFAYAPMDFSDFYLSNDTVITSTGPQLLGTTGNTFKLFDATLGSAGWTLSIDPVASTNPADVEASPTSNASNDLYVFTRYAGGNRGQLYYSALTAGAWSPASPLPINSVYCNDDDAKIIGGLATSVTIYFESSRSDAAGTSATCLPQRSLWMATYSGGAFSAVTRVPGIATGTSDDSQAFLTADAQTLYWTSVRGNQYGVFAATIQADGSWGNIHEVITPTTTGSFVGNVALVGTASIVVRPQGSLLYLLCGVAYNEHDEDTFHDADTVDLRPCVARRPN